MSRCSAVTCTGSISGSAGLTSSPVRVANSHASANPSYANFPSASVRTTCPAPVEVISPRGPGGMLIHGIISTPAPPLPPASPPPPRTRPFPPPPPTHHPPAQRPIPSPLPQRHHHPLVPRPVQHLRPIHLLPHAHPRLNP